MAADNGVLPPRAEQPTSKTSSERFYRPNLDRLRFFAFLSVFVSHVIPDSWIAEGQRFAVDLSAYASFLRFIEFLPHVLGAGGVVLFFILSSYLITTLLLKEHQREGTINLRHFYWRRILRIYPVYFLVL